jgi:hypothetical protein
MELRVHVIMLHSAVNDTDLFESNTILCLVSVPILKAVIFLNKRHKSDVSLHPVRKSEQIHVKAVISPF